MWFGCGGVCSCVLGLNLITRVFPGILCVSLCLHTLSDPGLAAPWVSAAGSGDTSGYCLPGPQLKSPAQPPQPLTPAHRLPEEREGSWTVGPLLLREKMAGDPDF